MTVVFALPDGGFNRGLELRQLHVFLTLGKLFRFRAGLQRIVEFLELKRGVGEGLVSAGFLAFFKTTAADCLAKMIVSLTGLFELKINLPNLNLKLTGVGKNL